MALIEGTRIDRELTPAASRRKKPRPVGRRVVGESAAEKTRPRQPVRGESAREKSGVSRQTRAREIFEEIQWGAPAKESMRRLLALNMTADEWRDFSRYTAVRSRQVQAAHDAQEQIAGVLIGPELAKLLPGGTPAREASKTGVGIDVALLAPGTITRGLTAPVRAAFRRAPLELGPRTPPPRTFRAGDLTVQVPAARSRTGRVIERGIDAARPVLSKATAGLVKSEEARVGLEVRRRDELRAKLETAPASALDRIRGLKPAEQVALLALAEETPTALRVARHNEWGANAASRTEKLYHGIHARLAGKAAKYLDEADDGTVRLRFDAPERLREAWRLMETAGEQRQDIYKGLGLLTEERVAARLSAPGRIYRGARMETQAEATAARGVRPQRARVEQIREYPARSRTITRTRTVNEAQERLAELDGMYDRLLRPLAERLFPASARQAEQARRNRLGSSRLPGKDRLGRNSGAISWRWRGPNRARVNTRVIDDAFEMAEEHIEKLAAKPNAHPTILRVAEIIAERERLQAAIGEAAFRVTPAEATARFAQEYARDAGRLVREYEHRFGNIVSTDIARELSRDYAESKTARARLASAVHETASQIAKDVYAAKLAKPAPAGAKVVFTAGGTGAGKTVTVADDVAHADIVYDTNLNRFDSAVEKIEQALAAGRDVDIRYVWRDPIEALVGKGRHGALERAAKRGRTVPLVEHVRTHVGANQTIRQLAEKYADDPRVSWRVFDNSGDGPPRLMRLADLPPLTYDVVAHGAEAALEAERAAGRVSDDVYAGFRSDPGGDPGRPRPGVEGDHAADARPAAPEVGDPVDAPFGVVEETIPGVPRRVRLAAQAAQKGVRAKPQLVGAEDFAGGSVYVGKQRGIPGMSLRGLGAVARSAPRMFSAGSRRAVAGGAQDSALTHEFTGRTITSGRFSTDTTGTVARGLRTASRLSRARAMRGELMQAARDVPGRADDLAVREDAFLGKRLPAQLGKLWDELEAIRAGADGRKALKRAEEIEDEISRAIHRELFTGDSPAVGKVKGIKWLSRDFAENAGLLEVPEATRLVTRGWSGLARAAAKTPVVALDVINDLARASVLGISFPAYHGVQLTQNAIMLTAGHGPLAVAKIPRAWRLSRQLRPEQLAKIDSGMQLDKLYQQRHMQLLSKNVTDPLAKFATMVADLGPRRTAFLNEAARDGFVTAAQLGKLLDDPKNFEQLKLTFDRANTVMGDFNKLSNAERQYVSRIFWFWPWTHVAFRYTARFPLDHPVLTAGVVAGDRKLQERADEQLGDRPYYARNYQQVGERDGLPRIVNTGPLTPFTTPLEFTQAAYAFATGRRDLPQLADRLTPALFGAGESLFGNRGGEYGLPAFAKSFADIPQKRRVEELLKNDEQRATDKEELLRPRTRGEAIAQVFAGPLAPSGYNPEIGEERAQELARDRMNPAQRAARKVFDEREQMFVEAKKLMPNELENGRLPKPLREAFNRKADRFVAYAQAGLKSGDDGYQRKAFAIDLKLFAKWGLATPAEIREAEEFLAKASDEEIEKLRRRWSDTGGPFHTAYLGTLGTARDALAEKGATLDEGE